MDTTALAKPPANQLAAPDKAFIAQADMRRRPRLAGDAAQPIAKELVHMVQQQLHTLEQHHLVWMGQVWPGQQMQWEIQGQPEHQARQEDERQWSTEMELSLPMLGDVHARLVFAGSGLRMTLRAADPATVDLFGSALPKLKNSLTGCGYHAGCRHGGKIMKQSNLTPQQVAVALTYGKSQGGAPKVVAKGRGMIAPGDYSERAKQNDIYVHESEDLVGLLMQVELDQGNFPHNFIWP